MKRELNLIEASVPLSNIPGLLLIVGLPTVTFDGSATEDQVIDGFEPLIVDFCLLGLVRFCAIGNTVLDHYDDDPTSERYQR